MMLVKIKHLMQQVNEDRIKDTNIQLDNQLTIYILANKGILKNILKLEMSLKISSIEGIILTRDVISTESSSFYKAHVFQLVCIWSKPYCCTIPCSQLPVCFHADLIDLVMDTLRLWQ